MKIRKENISARVSCALKKIVVDSDFSHREAYELGAKIIASGVFTECFLLNYSKLQLVLF